MPILGGYLLFTRFFIDGPIRRFIRKKVYFVKQLTGICWISCENFPLKFRHSIVLVVSAFFFCWSVVANLKSKSQILGQDKRAGLSHTLPNCRHTCRERPLSRWAAEPLKKLGFWPREPADIAHVSCRWLAISQGCSLRSFSYWLLAIALPDI